MCTYDVTSNIGNQNMQRGWKQAMFNIVDPGGGLSNTLGYAEYKAKGSPQGPYKSTFVKNSRTNPNIPQPKSPIIEEKKKLNSNLTTDYNPLQYNPLKTGG